MEKIIIIKYGELSTKKDNINFFLKVLKENIDLSLVDIEHSIKYDHGRMYIYAARETNTFDINENMLVEEIAKYNENAIYIETFDEIVDYLKNNVKEDDLIITIGAGPINEVGNKLLEKK